MICIHCRREYDPSTRPVKARTCSPECGLAWCFEDVAKMERNSAPDPDGHGRIDQLSGRAKDGG